MSTYTHTYVEIDDDGTEIERTDDVTRLVERTFVELDKKKAEVDALQTALADIKNRRYWEDIDLFTDKATGMVAAVRTTYRWQAETMRLDFTHEMSRRGV